jgi:hypothetical protein
MANWIITPCKAEFNVNGDVAKITPLKNKYFLPKYKKAWVKDPFLHTIGKPHAPKDVTHALACPDSTCEWTKALTYSDLLTSPLPRGAYIYRCAHNREFWIIGPDAPPGKRTD